MYLYKRKYAYPFFSLLLINSSIAQLKLGNTASQRGKLSLLERNGNKYDFLLPKLTDTTVINSLNAADSMLIYLMPATSLKDPTFAKPDSGKD